MYLAVWFSVFLWMWTGMVQQVSSGSNGKELLCTKPTDLAILLDTSASLDSKWQNVLRFTNTLVEGYDIGIKKTKVSIGTFGGGNQQIIMRFNTLTGDQLTMENVKEKIGAITNTINQERYIDQALAFANSQMFTKENGMRDDPEISRVLVMFLNGRHTKRPDQPSTPLNLATKDLRIKDVDVFAVGIPNVSDVDYDELSDIVTKPENAMTAKTYDEAHILAEDVAKMACGIKILVVSILDHVQMR